MKRPANKAAYLTLLLAVVGLVYGQQVQSGPATKTVSAGRSHNTKIVQEGGQIFRQQCQNCHNIGSSGGCLGPILAGESARRTQAFVESRISNEPSQIQQFDKSYGHAELMPHPRVPSETAKKLTAYILSLPAPTGGIRVRTHAKPAAAIASAIVPDSNKEALLRGKRLVYEKGCLSCHSIGGMGGGLAPAFDSVGFRRTPAQIAEKISQAQLMIGPEPEYNERGIVMPPSELSAKETTDIIAFLSTLK